MPCSRSVTRMRRVPALRVVDSYHDDPGYIKALVQNINDYWVKNGRPNKLVLSFHGVPRRSLELGDPYHCHCQKTGRLVAEELGLGAEQYVISFQSRFGRAEWLKPYTQPTLDRWPGKGSDGSTSLAPASSATAWRRSRRSATECGQRFSRRAARSFTTFPV